MCHGATVEGQRASLGTGAVRQALGFGVFANGACFVVPLRVCPCKFSMRHRIFGIAVNRRCVAANQILCTIRSKMSKLDNSQLVENSPRKWIPARVEAIDPRLPHDPLEVV